MLTNDERAELQRLRREQQLIVERDIPGKAVAWFTRASGTSLRVFAVASTDQGDAPGATMCRVFRFSQSGYDAWRTRLPSARARRDVALAMRIRAAHARAEAQHAGEPPQAVPSMAAGTCGSRLREFGRPSNYGARQRKLGGSPVSSSTSERLPPVVMPQPARRRPADAECARTVRNAPNRAAASDLMLESAGWTSSCACVPRHAITAPCRTFAVQGCSCDIQRS